MTPKSTKRQTSRNQPGQPGKVDPGIYLRTYDVINSLDRADHMPWWEKALGRVRDFQAFSQRSQAKALPAPPDREVKRFMPSAAPQPLIAGKAGALVVVERATQLQRELTLVRTDYAPVDLTHVIQRTMRARRFSWVLLAVVAVITAGVTFAVIHFAFSPTSATSGEVRSKRAATYISTRSEISTHLFLS